MASYDDAGGLDDDDDVARLPSRERVARASVIVRRC
jgi:hypothetical protein